jgi:hypothetical protein
MSEVENQTPAEDNLKEEEPPPPPKIELTMEMISQGFSQLTRSFTGASFVYGKFIAEVT